MTTIPLGPSIREHEKIMNEIDVYLIVDADGWYVVEDINLPAYAALDRYRSTPRYESESHAREVFGWRRIWA